MPEAELAQYKTLLEDERVSVLQFTSRDPVCGCEAAEEKAFDQLVGTYGPNVKFGRVFMPMCQGPAGFVCDSGVPSIRIHFGKGLIDVVRGRTQANLAQRLAAVVDRAKAGPPNLFGGLDTGRLVDLMGEPPLVSPTPEEAEAVRLYLTGMDLRFAALMCDNFNPELRDPLQAKVDAWHTRRKPMDADTFRQIGERISRSETQRLHYEANHGLWLRVKLNKASRAGCAEFMQIIDVL